MFSHFYENNLRASFSAVTLAFNDLAMLYCAFLMSSVNLFNLFSLSSPTLLKRCRKILRMIINFSGVIFSFSLLRPETVFLSRTSSLSSYNARTTANTNVESSRIVKPMLRSFASCSLKNPSKL